MEAVLTLEEVFAGLVAAVSHSSPVEEKRSRATRLVGKCHIRNSPVVASEATVFVLLEGLTFFCLV